MSSGSIATAVAFEFYSHLVISCVQCLKRSLKLQNFIHSELKIDWRQREICIFTFSLYLDSFHF